MNSALMFSKASDEWATPQDFYSRIFDEFGCTIDAAATEANTKCDIWYGPGSEIGEDSLALDWSFLSDQPHWLNPPYSRCKEFMAKAAAERLRGVLTVALVPARTDTRWFHDHLWGQNEYGEGCPQAGIELRFVRGRLKFGDGKNSAPFPSMVVVFRP